MVEHILLLRWTEEASQEAIDSVLAELRGLKGKIEGIVDLSCGANFSGRAKG
jgi:Stress responsive A/B Barrel Domain.